MREFNGKIYYDSNDVSERLGVTKRTINRCQDKYDVKPTFIGQQKYFLEEDIQKFIAGMLKTP